MMYSYRNTMSNQIIRVEHELAEVHLLDWPPQLGMLAGNDTRVDVRAEPLVDSA